MLKFSVTEFFFLEPWSLLYVNSSFSQASITFSERYERTEQEMGGNGRYEAEHLGNGEGLIWMAACSVSSGRERKWKGLAISSQGT